MNSRVRHGALLGALGVTLCTSHAASSRRTLQDHEVVMDQELLITAPAVVDSARAAYPGPWSFGHLLEEAFTAEKAPEMVARWLEEWADGSSKVAGRFLPAREGLRELVIEPWQAADGYSAEDGVAWHPDLANAPFQLLAIVNRMDLSVPLVSFNDPNSIPRSSAAYYGSSRRFDLAGGEGRFIFAVTDREGRPLEPGVTLILEYGLDISGSRDRFLDWAMAWHGLGTHAGHDDSYLADLEAVTRAFTDRRAVNDRESEERPSTEPAVLKSLPIVERLRRGVTATETQLMRIRTNDGAFGETREFREFGWTVNGLTPAPLAGTPREVFFRHGSTENRWLGRWLRIQRTEEVTAVVARDDPENLVPNAFALPSTVRVGSREVPVVAHVAPVPGNNQSYHWDGWGLGEPELRRAFSMQTCCGCHCGDTNTEFFHVAPREGGEAAPLSKFLRTDGSRWRARDPDNGRSFLSAEMDLRRELFEAALSPGLGSREMRELQERRRRSAH